MAVWGRRHRFAAFSLAFAACGAASPDPPVEGAPALPAPPRAQEGAAPAGTHPDAVVAEVDGEPIFAAEALRLLFLSVPDEAANAVRQLAIDRISAREARARGAVVPPEVVERELDRLIREQERKVREASKGRQGLEAWARATYGIEAAEWQAIVRGSLERSLLLERVVLDEMARHPRVELRMIRVGDRRLAEEIRDKLERGADFASLARQHSEDASARDGGAYPPLPSDLPSPLFESIESLAPGELSPVQEVSTGAGAEFRIVQVLSRLPPDDGAPEQRAAAIEELLDGRPLSPLELEAWMRLMEVRHPIRFAGLRGLAVDEAPIPPDEPNR